MDAEGGVREGADSGGLAAQGVNRMDSGLGGVRPVAAGDDIVVGG